jgi:hypothetical protein
MVMVPIARSELTSGPEISPNGWIFSFDGFPAVEDAVSTCGEAELVEFAAFVFSGCMAR